jgi:hypothetical protein
MTPQATEAWGRRSNGPGGRPGRNLTAVLDTQRILKGIPMLPDSLPDSHPPSDPRAWLDHCPTKKHSAVANWFHYAVRNGAATPEAVCSAVWQTIQRRLEWSTTPESRGFLLHCLDSIGNFIFCV